MSIPGNILIELGLNLAKSLGQVVVAIMNARDLSDEQRAAALAAIRGVRETTIAPAVQALPLRDPDQP